MTIFWKAVMTLAVVALVNVLQPTCVFACKCLPPGPPQEALANAAAVFAGRVTAIAAPADRGGAEPVVVTFAVAQGWKGAVHRTLVARTPASSASCGVDFVQGQEYLVYAQASEGQLQVTQCGRTTQLAMANEDLTALGQGTAPAEGATTLPATGGDITPWTQQPATLAGAALVLIVVGASVTRLRNAGNR